ncbi:MAG TPA: c-type cytochrome [Casimicrobiaceae bacterium]|nr:c-type cytochrome [Casimicrobiaceae bacterium]
MTRTAGFLLCAVAALTSTGCTRGETSAAAGDPGRGRVLLHQYGCNACHRIPRVLDAVGTVGPPLDDIAERVYLAGTLPNSPANMIAWIRSPQTFKPGTAMPDLGVGEQDARDMVAYLDRLR